MSASTFFSETCGVIGGVGPEATTYLLNLLIKFNPSKKDQDHIPVLIFTNPQIPDRTRDLLYSEASPLPELIHTGEVLKKAGATFLAMPCNTAHAYIEDLEKAVNLPVLNMISLTAVYIKNTYGENTKVGLLATDGTIQSKIYDKEFSRISSNIQLLTPEEMNQKQVMEAIYGERGIKAGYTTEENHNILYEQAKKLLKSGAHVIIEACTEIPLVLPPEACDFASVDPMEILAKEILKKTLVSKVN